MRLTDFGVSPLVRAKVIVAEHDRAVAEPRAFRSAHIGDVTLGLRSIFAQLLTVDAL